MELKPFIAKTVKPGEPVTAQAWNDIVEALDVIFQFVESARHVLRVTVASSAPVSALRVTAEAASGAVYQAVAPVGGGSEWVVSGLEPGSYTVRGEALGYVTASAAVTIGEADEESASLTLTAAQPFMPDLFGKKLNEARTLLQAQGITLSRLWDCLGTELVPSNPGQLHADAPVFVQWPAAAAPVLANMQVALVVAGRQPPEELVELPSLIGKTQAEAQKILAQLGLVLEKADIKKSK